MYKNTIRRLYLKTLKRGYYLKHQDDLDTFLDLIPVGSLCFDVGANRGDKTKALLASGMQVVSFEPQAEYLSHIEHHCSDYVKRLQTRNTAVGSTPGEARLYLSEHIGEASLNPDWSSQSTDESIRVPVTTLDHEIEKFGCPYYCKVDVEGFELEVFRGLSRSLPLISFEYHLNEENIALTWQCLDRLNELADISCNITGAENNTLHFKCWKTWAEFKQLFPHEFQGERSFRYGDIYVRRNGTE